ncbi:uncharacterized protein trdc isoform X1 [Epinephelus lanceolatus]
MFVLSPLQPEGQENYTRGPEVCLATDFRPQVGTLVLNATEGLYNVMTSEAVLSTTQKTYYYAAFTNQTLHSCELHGTLGKKEIIEPCADIHPGEPTNAPEHESQTLIQTGSSTERAKLNYFLLVMHAVRVVFTKTLAFNTILTIRAVLF